MIVSCCDRKGGVIPCTILLVEYYCPEGFPATRGMAAQRTLKGWNERDWRGGEESCWKKRAAAVLLVECFMFSHLWASLAAQRENNELTSSRRDSIKTEA